MKMQKYFATILIIIISLFITQSGQTQCGSNGAIFTGNAGPFSYEGEFCFDGNVVTVLLSFPNPPYPTGVIAYIPNSSGGIPGYGMIDIATGEYSYAYTANNFDIGELFNLEYFTIQDSGNSPSQYQTSSYSETLIIGCSDGSADGLMVNAGNDITILEGSSTNLNSTITNGQDPLTYNWIPSTGLSDASIEAPTASPATTTSYTLEVTDSNGCTGSDQITITVVPPSPCIVEVGSGSYSMDLPSNEIGPSDNSGNPIPTLFTNNLQAPFPTSDWWSSLAFPLDDNSMYSHNLYPRPLSVKAESDGLIGGYPSRFVSTNTVFHNFKNDFTVGLVGLNATDTKVAAYGDWTVTADWNNGEFQATFGHGLPFIYCEKNSSTDALVRFAGANITIFYDDGNYLGITRDGRHYGLFAPTGAAWTQSGAAFSSNLDGQNYFSVAALPDNTSATIEEFADHAFAFVTDTEIAWSYDESTAKVTTTFTATTTVKEGTEEAAVLCLFPHQWKNSTADLTDYIYESGKGDLKIMFGNDFQTTLTNKGALPHLPELEGEEATWLYTQIDEHYNNLNIGSGGTYWQGKELNKFAQLIPIAEQVGHEAAKEHWLNLLKGSLEDWFSTFCNDVYPMLYYDPTVGTMIGFPADFAMNSRMDDHHFHWGYFVSAAATVASYDPEWAEDWGGLVELLIKDVANWDRTDTQFPFLRSMDPYVGHSWASGWSAFADGNNEESTSEAIHFAAGVLRWGAETCNPLLHELGMYLYLTETTSAQQYWFDVDDSNFPADFEHNYTALQWGGKMDYATWFSGDAEQIHGINYLPITGYSLHLGQDPNYVAINYNEMETYSANGTPSSWFDVLWSYLALTDPSTAIEEFNNNYPYGNTDGGDTYGHTYHWLNSLGKLGNLQIDIQADISHFAVFTKNDTLTYAAYNPVCNAPRLVTFTDGTSFSVNPGELKTYVGDSLSLFVEDAEVAPEILVYPNPTNNLAYIHFHNISTKVNVLLEIYNSTGKKIKTVFVDDVSSTHNVDFSEFPSGMYSLRLVSGQKTLAVERIVRQ